MRPWAQKARHHPSSREGDHNQTEGGAHGGFNPWRIYTSSQVFSTEHLTRRGEGGPGGGGGSRTNAPRSPALNHKQWELFVRVCSRPWKRSRPALSSACGGRRRRRLHRSLRLLWRLLRCDALPFGARAQEDARVVARALTCAETSHWVSILRQLIHRHTDVNRGEGHMRISPSLRPSLRRRYRHIFVEGAGEWEDGGDRFRRVAVAVPRRPRPPSRAPRGAYGVCDRLLQPPHWTRARVCDEREVASSYEELAAIELDTHPAATLVARRDRAHWLLLVQQQREGAAAYHASATVQLGGALEGVDLDADEHVREVAVGHVCVCVGLWRGGARAGPGEGRLCVSRAGLRRKALDFWLHVR